MQLPGELDERCRAGAPGKQAFGAKATAERPRGEVTARVPAGEQPPFRMALCGIDELDDGVAEDLWDLDRLGSDGERHGLRARIDLCPGDRDDAGQLDAVEQYEKTRGPGLRVHVGIGQEPAGHLPSVVGGIVSPFEAMGSKLDAKGAQPVVSQPASERCQRVALAGRIGQMRVE